MIQLPQMYGRAYICEDAIDDALLCSKLGIDFIANAVYKMNLLAVCNAAYSDRVKLIVKRKSPIKTNANYEDRICAAFTKLSSNKESVSIHGTLAAW